MKHIEILLLCLLFSSAAVAQQKQNTWQTIEENRLLLPQNAEVYIPTEKYLVFDVNFDLLKRQLADAPEEFAANSPAALQLSFPLPDGTYEVFSVVHSPVMGPELSAKYPSIRSFKIVSTSNKLTTGRIDYSPKGFHAYIDSPKGIFYIDPYADVATNYHVAYYAKDMVIDQDQVPALSCGVHDLHTAKSPLEDLDLDDHFALQKSKTTALISLRTYRLALACTGEYAQANGGSVESVLSSMNTAVNRVNQIFEQEVAVRLVIIDRNDELVFLDAATDPYNSPRDGTALLAQNTTILNGRIGFGTYDIGHVFTRGCDNGLAGVANPSSVCQSNKGAGVTCHYTSDLEKIAVEVMAHEIGHQFSCGHSWNNCPQSANQMSFDNAFEPGSGSTIMSYAGLCGGNNIQPNSDPYYNIGSLEDFIQFSREDGGNNCPTLTPTDNHTPSVEDTYLDGFTIPINTPFKLSASGTDEDGDPITYCWEQYDIGPASTLGSPTGDAPLFRSYPPTTDSMRYFPNLGAILNNANLDVELLPSYSRFLTFRCTVRDNNPQAGGVAWTQVNFKASNTAGPFKVTSPNTNAVRWQTGSSQEITWDVANTDNSVVNCQTVNIWLSTDGGLHYPYLLLEKTANDGQAFITVPELVSTQARIMVEAADNIFFDLSNTNFVIEAGQSPSFSLAVNPLTTLDLCPPTTTSLTIAAASNLGFSGPISLDVVGNLPENTTFSFSKNPIAPAESSQLDISFNAFSEGVYDFLIRAHAGTDTIYRDVRVATVSNDFSSMALVGPADGTTGVVLSTNFSWMPSENADTYAIEVATSPTFVPESIILQADNLTQPTYTPSIQFEANHIYFWRVRPENGCGPGPFLEPFAFQTTTAECVQLTATGVPVTLPGSGLPTRELTINIPTSGIISDLNIPRVRGSFQPVNSLRISVTSPSNKTAILFDKNCGNTTNLDLGFDSQAPLPIQCAPDDNLIFQPVESLDIFTGEDTQGDWKLKVEVVKSGFGGGGRIDEWKLEYCASLSPSYPTLLTNDTLFVPPGQYNIITKSKLEVQDPDQNTLELTYTIITMPAYGNVLLDGVPLKVGDQFLQAHINANRIVYEHDGSAALADRFTFIVEDGTGGWLPTQVFQIKIDENAVVGTNDLLTGSKIKVFPNPAHDVIQVLLDEPQAQQLSIELRNIQGQLVQQKWLAPNTQKLSLDVQQYPAGIYFLNIHTTEAVRSFKVVVQ
ncbi:MAG: M12 family metallo-peptidase [Saprospiraceae bacterium]